AAHASIGAGRELVASLRCVNCHKSDAAVTGGMPELRQDAPNLSVAAERLRPQWLAYWISNPRSLRPDATMPRVLHDLPAGNAPAVDPRAQDIAAYLTANAPAGGDDAASSDDSVVGRGGHLFTSLGCVACHVAPAVEDSDATLKRVPLKYVKAKYRPAGLVEFLKKPEAHYAWIRMPDFRLADDEATALASFLLSRAKDDALPANTLAAGDAAKGKQLFESVGCMNCHTVEASGSPRPAMTIELSKADWSRGCAADDAASIGKGVDFSFTADQRAALRAFGPAHLADLSRDPPPEFAARQMSALRCNACHSIDDRDNSWSNLDDEIQKIEQDLPAAEANGEQQVTDQSRPPLTWVGEKLHAGWMGKFIAGQVPYKPRQWIVARMPGFPARAQGIANGFAMSHGFAPSESAEPPVDAKLADVGRTLTSRTGFGCVACHGVGDQPPLAPFEAPSINFAHVTDRMRHDFFSRWIRHPQYYLPGTKMPQFSDANGRTAYKNVLGGDASQQYEAIWQYLRAGDQITPPQ
ncbi:MAG TPA: hypothetical protein VLI90_16295, partial [Tepidisphaeraceae bacterium]|nr:hypothetical protein [Tepidisphaeraceae bacterium]